MASSRNRLLASYGMIEITRAVDGATSPLSVIPDRVEKTEETIREKAHRLCCDYLRGAWLNTGPNDITVKQVSGGLSNLMYYCALPEGTQTNSNEPSRLLIRLYGKANSAKASENLVTEVVIFTLLSESQRGPRLYGVFPGGRLEEYIPARPLLTRELSDPVISSFIADKMAQIHLMDVPISKKPTWLWQTMEDWIKEIEEFVSKGNIKETNRAMVEAVKQLNLAEEFEWLKDFLKQVKSPVVFSHNDLQEGNILLRDSAYNDVNYSYNFKTVGQTTTSRPASSESLVVIDFEYCSYNNRGFDFANHFCEWKYDYTNQEPPFFWELESNEATTSQKALFIDSYLKAIQKYPEYKASEEDTREHLMQEVEAFTLAPHFLWALWSVVNSTASEITFDYWGFGESRFAAYFKHKENLLATSNQTGGDL